jgi:thermitase
MPRISQLVTIGIIFILGAVSSLPPRPVQASDNPIYEPDQVIVKIASSATVPLETINQAYGTTTLALLFNRPDVALLQVPAGVSTEQMVQVMASDPRLSYAELNYLVEDPEYGSTDRVYGWGGYETDPYTGQSSTRSLSLEDANGYSRGAGSLIAILDTGVQLDHPTLASQLDPLGFDFVDNDPFPQDEANGLDDDNDGLIDEGYGHGTHVAGIALLVAPEARVMALRVLNSDGRGNVFKTATALLYAAYYGAEVINMSLGMPQPSALLRDAVNEAAKQGVVLIAAAGNLNSQVKQYPAADGCTISVTSINHNSKKSSFASYGDWIDLVAPGEEIYSTFPVNGYAWGTGTSMATPFVAGQAALLLSANPYLTLDQIGKLMGGTAIPLDLNNPGYRDLLGLGRVDILSSLQAQADGSGYSLSRNVLANCKP